jgi:hypothetical protein
MLLDVPYRRMGTIDTGRLERAVDRLSTLFAPGAPLWSTVRARSQYIGREDRPADVAFRKMRPERYVQLFLVNDEQPPSPWALPIPSDVIGADEQRSLAEEHAALCARFYGEGTLTFSGFAVLAPGGRVPPHRDMPHDPNKKKYSHHLHVAITGAGGVTFRLKGYDVVLAKGTVYEIDNMTTHAVVHHGDDVRVNLMLDYCPAASLALRG